MRGDKLLVFIANDGRLEVGAEIDKKLLLLLLLLLVVLITDVLRTFDDSVSENRQLVLFRGCDDSEFCVIPAHN